MISRFDVAEAASIYAHDFCGSPGANRAGCQLSRMRFRARPSLNGVADLEPDGKAAYASLIRSREPGYIGTARLIARVRRCKARSGSRLALGLGQPWRTFPPAWRAAARLYGP